MLILRYWKSRLEREGWHPLKTKGIGSGYVIDGARCIHLTMETTTHHLRVLLLDFHIAIRHEMSMQLTSHRV